MQSDANRSPYPNSLLTGKLTGKLADSGPSAPIFAPSKRANSVACSKIPYPTEQGISRRISGKIFKEQGNSETRKLVHSCGSKIAKCKPPDRTQTPAHLGMIQGLAHRGPRSQPHPTVGGSVAAAAVPLASDDKRPRYCVAGGSTP
jgi:hypothetical protein